MFVTYEKSPDIIDKIKANFVEDGDYTKDVMAGDFKWWMTKWPDTFCVIVGWDGETPRGHLVANAEPNRTYVFLQQAYSQGGHDMAITGFAMLEIWARGLGRKSIRMETEKDSVQQRALKNWNFDVHGVVMERQL